MKLTLKVWRQEGPNVRGRLETYQTEASPDMSFLEMLDVVNEQLTEDGKEPIVFEHDCREGICGSCSLMINGIPHGPQKATATCQLHMRSFKDGDTIVVEPWRAKAFPIVRDLMVDRGSFDRIMQAGGYVSVSTGNAPDANAMPIGKVDADSAFDAAACIGCGACVATCKNASASLFVAAKVAQLRRVPQGQPERMRRAQGMLDQMDKEGFGACTNTYDCQAACPKNIDVKYIAEMNRDYIKASLTAS